VGKCLALRACRMSVMAPWPFLFSLFSSAGMLAGAWWDLGHMLTAQVAMTQLTDSDVEKINAVLLQWSSDFPGASDLPNVAVWADLIKCTHFTPFCRKALPDALGEFDSWHFSDMPFNPDKVPISEEERNAGEANPSAVWSLTNAISTFKSSQSVFGFNLMLRFTIHVVGDIHQPLHAVDGYFNDTRFGTHLHGDRGGNLIHLDTPWEGVTNLHAMWDSAGGLYTLNWPLSQEEREQLGRNASDLVQKFPPSSLPQFKESDAEDCWGDSERAHPKACTAMFERWAAESHALAESEAYGHGIAENSKPSDEYVSNTRHQAQRQIALGGYRLATILRLLVPNLPQIQPESLAAKDSGSTISFPVVLCAVLATTVLFLMVVLRKLLRQTWSTMKFQRELLIGSTVV